MAARDLNPDVDVSRESDISISTQIYWQLAYQIDAGRRAPGSTLPTVRNLANVLHVNVNTISAVYQRLADSGHVTTRQGSRTIVAERPSHRRGSHGLATIVSEALRQAGTLGFTPDEVVAATYASAAERRRPGPHVRILFAECTSADARYHALKLSAEFKGHAEIEGALLRALDRRTSVFHYDLLATNAYHAEEARIRTHGRIPVVAMLAVPSHLNLNTELMALRAGSTIGIVGESPSCASDMATALALPNREKIVILKADPDHDQALETIDHEADLILLSREAEELGIAKRFKRRRRLRSFSYELDPSGLELLRHEIESIRQPVDGAGIAPATSVLADR